MKIWLLRHGEAEPARGRDADRQLTTHGREQVLAIVSHLQQQPLDQILCSPYIRARQTTEVLLEALELDKAPLIAPWLVPDESVQAAVRQLDSLPGQNILLVTHQPLVGLLGSWLCHGSFDHPLPMGTASLACLEGDFAVAGLMHLQALHHPQV